MFAINNLKNMVNYEGKIIHRKDNLLLFLPASIFFPLKRTSVHVGLTVIDN